MVSYFLLPRRTMFLCYGTLEKDFSTLYFRVNYIVEVFTLMTSVTTAVTACDTLFFYFAWHIYVEFSLLKIAFQKWNEQQITDRKQFTEAVKHHDFLLNFVNDLNEVYSFLFLFQYFLSLIGICFGLFMLTRKGLPPSAKDVWQFAPATTAFIIQIFTICKIGDLITNLSVDITDIIFYANWMSNEVYENKTARLIILNRALKPAKFSVGKFADLDLRTFILIIRNAFSFLAFVKNFLN